MIAELWSPVPEYDDFYDISDHGNVLSKGRYVGAGGRYAEGRLRWLEPRILSPSRSATGGYLEVKLHRDGAGKTLRVCRLVLLAFVGPCPPGMQACHNNGDPADNRLSNLRWDTSSANVLDQVRHGTHHMSRRAQCKNGHPLTAENIYRYGNARICKRCAAINGKRNRGRLITA